MKTPLATLTLFVLLLTGLLPIGAQDNPSQPAEPDLIPELEPITAANAARLQPLAMLGVDLINDAAWSPDSKTVIVAGSAGLWRYDTQQQPDAQPQLIEGYSGLFRSVAYSAKGFLVTGSDQGVLRFWDTTTWMESERLQASDRSIERLAFNPTGTLLAVGTETGVVTLWEVATHKILQTWNPVEPYDEHRVDILYDYIRDMVFSSDGKKLAVINRRNSRLFDVSSGRETVIDDWGGAGNYGVAFSPDNRVLVVGSPQSHGEGAPPTVPLYLFDADTGKLLKAISAFNNREHLESSFLTLASRGNNTILVGDASNQIVVWQIDDLLQLPVDQSFGGDDGIYGEPFFADASNLTHRILPGGKFFRLSPSETTLAVINNATVQLIDVETGTQKTSSQLPDTDGVEDGWVNAITFNPTRPLMAYSNAEVIRLINTETGQPEKALTGHEAGIVSLTFSHDGKRLFSGGGGSLCVWCDSLDGEPSGVRVWNLNEYKQEAVLNGYENAAARLLKLSSNEELIATSWGYTGGSVKVWDWTEGQQLQLPDESASFVAFNPQELVGAVIVNDYRASNGRALLWDIQRNLYVTLFESQDGTLGKPVFSPDGTWLAIPNKTTVYLWNIKTGDRENVVEGGVSKNAFSPVFSADGKELAYLTGDGIAVRDIITGRERLWIDSETDFDPSYYYYSSVGNLDTGVFHGPLFFSPDGTLIFYDGRLWDSQTGKLLASVGIGTMLYGWYGDIMTMAAMSPDSKLVAYSIGSGVRLWGVPKQ